MMASKYAHVIGSLKRILGTVSEQPGYQDKVQAVKERILEKPSEEETFFGDTGMMTENAEALVKAVHQSLLRQCAGKRHASEFLKAYLALRALKNQMAAWESNTNLLLEAYTQLLGDQMEVEGTTTLKVHGRGVSSFLEPYPVVRDKDAFRDYCLKDDDLARKMTLMPQTMSSLVKQALSKGEELPPGVEVFAKLKMRLVGVEE